MLELLLFGDKTLKMVMGNLRETMGARPPPGVQCTCFCAVRNASKCTASHLGDLIFD